VIARLCAGAAALGVPLAATQAEGLLRLLDELSAWNQAYNLTAITERAAMLTHHLLDSLAINDELAGSRVLDLGTGAGFPGLPLALLNPQRQFTLLDGTAKKIRFVAHAARCLGLVNVQAVHGRAGHWQPELRFDTVVARAVAPLAALAALATPLLAPGGRLLACKGRLSEAEAELATLPAGWQLEALRELRVPGLEAQRCVLRLVAASPLGGVRAASPAA
jgi:16S rRNA (guanine527-N7)-methyltransferase